MYLALSSGNLSVSEPGYWRGSPVSPECGEYDYTIRLDASFPVKVVQVGAVPLPAGLPLVLTGLAGFAGLRLRKKRSVQV